MRATATGRPHAEFMRVWEEGYVATSAMFEAMHMQGIGLFSGGGLRRADGALDRARIRDWVAAATRGIPYANLRLMRSPAGLTPPAWVPDDDFDIDRHLRFAEGPLPVASTTLPSLIGWDEGPLDCRPAAVAAAVHRARRRPGGPRRAHAPLRRRCPADAQVPGRADHERPRRLARRGRGPVPRAAGAAPGRGAAAGSRCGNGRTASKPGALWRDYWRLPVARRARRVAGRLLRPIRDRSSPAPGVARSDVRTGFRTLPAATVQSAAEAAGSTMNDMVVASAIRTASTDGARVRVRVPVLRRRTEDSRNRVTDVAIVGGSSQPVPELVASVRRQLSADEPLDAGSPARDVGYATLVPWLSRARHLCGARLDDMIVLPAWLPDDELSTFALLYDGNLSVVATAQSRLDIDEVMDRLTAALAGADV